MALGNIFQHQPLKNCINLYLCEVKLRQLSPDSLLLNDKIHQRPRRSSRLQVFVIAHLQDDLPDALLRQLRELRMTLGVGLNVDLTSNVLDSLDRLKVRHPHLLAAERLSPASRSEKERIFSIFRIRKIKCLLLGILQEFSFQYS